MRQPSPLGRADAVLGGYRSTEIPDESIDDRLDIVLGLFGKAFAMGDDVHVAVTEVTVEDAFASGQARCKVRLASAGVAGPSRRPAGLCRSPGGRATIDSVRLGRTHRDTADASIESHLVSPLG